jgi:predicted  nucleic acid-binding Zn-ribbon protein
LAELSKYEILLNDISQVETRISVLRDNLRDSYERKKEAEGYLNELKQENIELKQRISELEEEIKLSKKLDLNSLSSLNVKEREALKSKIQNLISRIDYHLSS